jgi:hypothetical protein
VLGGVFMLGFKTMDTHMAEMMNDGWRVQSQNHQPKGPGFLPGVKKPGTMMVTYVKD